MIFFVLKKRIVRVLIVIVLLILFIPLIFHYLSWAFDASQAVQFQPPRGEALKVSAEEEVIIEEDEIVTAWERILYFMRDFFQNKL